MAIYLIAITMTLILIFITNAIFIKKESFAYYFFSIVSLLPATAIAGVRDLTIGTDIRHYVVPNFLAAQNFSNMFDYVRFVNSISTSYVDTVNHTEIGYSMLVFAVSKFTSNPGWLMFILQGLTVLGVYIGLNLFKNGDPRVSVTLGMTVYYTLFFGPSLNVMRQSLAASLVFLAVALFYKKNYIKSCIIFLIATQFHLTSIIGIIIFLIWIYMRSNYRKPNLTKIPPIVYILIVFFSMLVIGPWIFRILQFLISNVSFLQKYTASLDSTGGYSISGTVLFVISDVILFLTISILNLGQNSLIIEKENKLSRFLFTIVLISVFFYGMYAFQNVIPRLGIFFAIFRVFSYSYYLSKIRDSGIRMLTKIFFVSLLFIIFVKVTTSGSGEIYPYTSETLSQLINSFF